MITLIELHDEFAIMQIDTDQPIPASVFDCDFYSITKTKDEVSIIVNRHIDIPNARISDGWRGFKVEGILDFAMVGVIYNIIEPLKENDISVFVTSTYNTDYVLVKESSFDKSVEILENTDYIKLNKVIQNESDKKGQ
jgi:uncharacterized protein